MPAPDDAVTDLGDTLGALFKVVFRQRLPLAIEGTSVTHEQWGVLAELARAGRPLAMGELAAARSLGLASATALVDRLVAAGLVQRSPEPADRRVVRVGLTGEGSAFQARLLSARRDELASLVEALEPAERAALLAARPALAALVRVAVRGPVAAGGPRA